MATQRPAVDAFHGEFAELLLSEREVVPRARVIANQAAALIPGAAIVVYLFDAEAMPRWSSKAAVGDVTPHASCESVTLAILAERAQPILFSGEELVREHFTHIDVRRTVASLAYVPVQLEDVLVAAIEAVSFDRILNEEDLAALAGLADLSAVAIATAVAYENERNSGLASINRLTQFYDLEKVFHSTLQMDELMPIVTAKIRELLEVQAVNLWMLEGNDMLLMSRNGVDNTCELGATAGDIVNQVGDSGQWLTLAAPEPRLGARNAGVQDGAITSLLVYPVVYSDAIVGVLECINKRDETPFDDDDVFFLATVSESAATALHNASLLEAERKIEILQTLVEVSNEITSTLNLERVLQVVVNSPTRVMSYERAAVALEESGGKLQVKSISGVTEVVQNDPAVRKLREMLEFCSAYDGEVSVIGRPEYIEADREETKARFRDYMIETGVRAWYSVPLADDQGRLGIMSFESTDADAFGEAQIEFIKVVAAQATVAVRNASLYQEVPLIGVLQPLIQKKRQFMRMEKRRRVTTVALTAAALLFLVFFPLPMRVSGDATVAPQSSARVQAEVPGVVRRVYVAEGDHVAKGTILADMDDWDYRSALAAAQAKYAIALAAMNRALAASDGAEAGIQRVQANYWNAEVTRAGERLNRTRLRSPIEGVVATPHPETLVGRKLDFGDTFADVISSSHAIVDVAIDETDLPLLQPGDYAAVKLESFPTRKFPGRVELISPSSTADKENEKRVFFARVDVPNPNGLIRPGMQGLTKIRTGWRPAGYVLFRGIGMWAWSKLWSWFGW